MTLRAHLALSAMICLGLGRVALAGEMRSLFDGHDLEGWDTFMAKPDRDWNVPGLKRDANGKYLEAVGLNRDPLGVFKIERVDGRPAVHVSGQGFGVMTTREAFGNFHLRLQVKWGEKKWGYKRNSARDAGLLYFVHSAPGFDHETWPRSLEFQIQEHDIGDLYALGAQVTVDARPEMVNGRTLFLYDPAGPPTLFIQKLPIGNRCVKRGDPEEPRGQWNTLDLFCCNGDSIHVVNGVVVMRLHQAERIDGVAPVPLTAGQISLQTEGAEVYYRDIAVEPIDRMPAEYAKD